MIIALKAPGSSAVAILSELKGLWLREHCFVAEIAMFNHSSMSPKDCQKTLHEQRYVMAEYMCTVAEA